MKRPPTRPPGPREIPGGPSVRLPYRWYHGISERYTQNTQPDTQPDTQKQPRQRPGHQGSDQGTKEATRAPRKRPGHQGSDQGTQDTQQQPGQQPGHPGDAAAARTATRETHRSKDTQARHAAAKSAAKGKKRSLFPGEERPTKPQTTTQGQKQAIQAQTQKYLLAMRQRWKYNSPRGQEQSCHDLKHNKKILEARCPPDNR